VVSSRVARVTGRLKRRGPALPKQIAERLWDDLPELRNRNFAIVVTDERGERVCQVPIDRSH
jgi:hypothetical protein